MSPGIAMFGGQECPPSGIVTGTFCNPLRIFGRIGADVVFNAFSEKNKGIGSSVKGILPTPIFAIALKKGMNCEKRNAVANAYFYCLR